MKQSLATRIRVKRIKDIACKYTNANPDIFNVRRRKYMVDTKRLAAWLFWYYSSTASKRIGEYLSVDHSTVFFSVRKLNHLIETDWRIADMVLLAEKEMSSMGMKKQNRIACSMRKES